MTSGRNHSLRFFPEAVDDLVHARDWYNEQSQGLGDDFIAEFWATVGHIDNFPESGMIKPIVGVKYEIRRSRFVGRFPFGIVHFLAGNGSDPVLVAVNHDRSHPDRWKTRAVGLHEPS